MGFRGIITSMETLSPKPLNPKLLRFRGVEGFYEGSRTVLVGAVGELARACYGLGRWFAMHGLLQ